jgi:hypothetical protein
MFCIFHHISASFISSQGQRQNVAVLAFAKLSDILSVASHLLHIHCDFCGLIKWPNSKIPFPCPPCG